MLIGGWMWLYIGGHHSCKVHLMIMALPAVAQQTRKWIDFWWKVMTLDLIDLFDAYEEYWISFVGVDIRDFEFLIWTAFDVWFPSQIQHFGTNSSVLSIGQSACLQSWNGMFPQYSGGNLLDTVYSYFVDCRFWYKKIFGSVCEYLLPHFQNYFYSICVVCTAVMSVFTIAYCTLGYDVYGGINRKRIRNLNSAAYLKYFGFSIYIHFSIRTVFLLGGIRSWKKYYKPKYLKYIFCKYSYSVTWLHISYTIFIHIYLYNTSFVRIKCK